MRGESWFAWLLLAPALAACLDIPEGEPAPSHGEPVPPQAGLVVASQVVAAQAGAEILGDGGNAIDAAAAVQWALNVVEPSMSGLGGGTFLVVYLAGPRQVFVLDGREEAPLAATPDMFLTPAGAPQPYDYAHRQGYAVGVPGTLRLFDEALDRWGTRTLAETFGPAITLAEDGVTVTPRLSALIDAARDKLESWPASAEVFLTGSVCVDEVVGCHGGEPLQPGDRLVQEDLAATFRLIAARGPRVFYEDEVGADVVATTTARDGRLNLSDLGAYDVREREAVRFSYAGHDFASAPPPSSGGLTLGQTMLLLEPLDLAGAGHNSADALHLMAESMHLAYADRAAYMADPDFVRVPGRGLLHPGYVAERRALIEPATANPDVGPGDPWGYETANGTPAQAAPPQEGGSHTSHFVVVDAWGNVAAVTTTLEDIFGTGMVVPGRGFLLNNQMTDFDFTPGGANEVAPGKRPRSSMTPTLVFRDGDPWLALGSPGGPTIITSVLQVALNVVEYGMELDAAVLAARIHSSRWPDVFAEPGIDIAARADLATRGHVVRDDGAIGVVQAALRGPDGVWTGVADGRSSEGGVVYVPPAHGSATPTREAP